MNVSFSRAAADGLENILAFSIVQFGPNPAENMREAFREHLSDLAERPMSFQSVTFNGKIFRRSALMSFAIYFQPLDRGIFIVRILGQQDAAGALDQL